MARGRKKTVHKEMRRGNSTGSIYKMSGNRRRPWTAQISDGTVRRADGSYIMKRIRLGYYATREEATVALAKYLESPYKLQDKFSFSEVYELWSKQYFPTIEKSSERTVISAYTHSAPLYHRNFAAITIQDMRETIASCKSPHIQSRMKSLYNLMYDFAVEAEIVEINKARQFSVKGLEKAKRKVVKEKIPISDAHVHALESDYEFGYNRMILIGIYSGFRPSELCQLQRKNVHLEENYIIGGMKTEAGEDRYVPIHPKIKDFIRYYYERTNGSDEFLIKAEDGQNDTVMTFDKYRARFNKSMKRIGATGLYTPHCTRHAFITSGKKNDMDEYALKMIVGHEINDVTERVYTHRDSDFLQKEILKIKY